MELKQIVTVLNTPVHRKVTLWGLTLCVIGKSNVALLSRGRIDNSITV